MSIGEMLLRTYSNVVTSRKSHAEHCQWTVPPPSNKCFSTDLRFILVPLQLGQRGGLAKTSSSVFFLFIARESDTYFFLRNSQCGKVLVNIRIGMMVGNYGRAKFRLGISPDFYAT